MGYIKADINDLRENLNSLIGEEILIIEPISKRGKKLAKLATVENTYNSYFRVTLEDNKSVNYNYSDIFTKDITIQTYQGDNFEPLKVPRPLTKKETIPSLDYSESWSDLN